MSNRDATHFPGKSTWKVAVVVAAMLSGHVALAVDSLLRENPTVDEVAHLPAGVTYWEKGTFKLYHHNPPLVKLVAAAPVVLAGPETAPLYQLNAWANESQSTFAEFFALVNAPRYFELFARARLMMPAFSVLGGLVVFAWSCRLFGAGGGLLSLALWCFCPNVLAHGRLVTTDVAAAGIGAGATYLFWRYQHRPSWNRALIAGLALGVAELTKFSLVLLYLLWPTLAVVRWWFEGRKRVGWAWRVPRGIGQFGLMVGISILVIDAGYGFEKVGQPLGKYEFSSRSLTRQIPTSEDRPRSPNLLLEMAWSHRVNRFRGTWLEALPVPLPRHYVLGFDEQKLESEGIPLYFGNPALPPDEGKTSGYPVYLDGTLRWTGWWYYYLATLAYKVPEGTWVLVTSGLILLVCSKRARVPWADEAALLLFPAGAFAAMSFLTDICLGLRYVLPIFPYLFVATGRVVPWVGGLPKAGRRVAVGVVIMALAGNAASVAWIHPHYLSYFNLASGGPDRGSEHLIDSNLDWGQDLVGLERYLRERHPGRRVGLAYFGQVNPSIFKLRGGGFDWFLPPARPGTIRPTSPDNLARLDGPAPRLTPGLYAVSASLVRGLPWRLFDGASARTPQTCWQIAWRAEEKAFDYFQALTPVARVGHSIYVYEVTAEDCQRLAPTWPRPRVGAGPR